MDNEAPEIFTSLEREWDCSLLELLVDDYGAKSSGAVDAQKASKASNSCVGGGNCGGQGPCAQKKLADDGEVGDDQIREGKLKRSQAEWPVRPVEPSSVPRGDFTARMAPASLGDCLSHKSTRLALDNPEHFDPISKDEVYDIIRHMKDPEHPELTLEQLRVVRFEDIFVTEKGARIEITPTVPTCSLSTLIGLAILSKCRKNLPLGFKTSVAIKLGTHDQAEVVNRQLADKERVIAALENPNLMNAIRGCLVDSDLLPVDFCKPIWNKNIGDSDVIKFDLSELVESHFNHKDD